jgi:cell wall-associated NlpC family hydrolase
MSSYRGFHQLLCAFALTAATASATGAPDAPGAHASGDAVLQLLHERGLLSAASQEDANAVVHRMRDAASEMVLSAMNFLGVPYKRGGDSAEEGFDCSGFTRHIFEMSIGMVLPRRADQQAQQAGLLTVKRDELKPGDLVFFNTMRRAFSHVGIYVGDGKFIHAPRTGGQVRVEDMRQAYWVKRYNGARRAERAMTPALAAPSGVPPLQTSLPAGPVDRPSGIGD